MRNTSETVALARKLLPDMRKEYESAITEWERGERKSLKQGMRPHYCIHGANLWDEYESCGCCEMYGFNYMPSPIEAALSEARRRRREFERRVDVAAIVAVAGAPIALVRQVSEWAREALEG